MTLFQKDFYNMESKLLSSSKGEVTKIRSSDYYKIHSRAFSSFYPEKSFCQYIRERKMMLSAIELMMKISDIGDLPYIADYTEESFRRAFKIFHTVLPSRVKNGEKIKIYNHFWKRNIGTETMLLCLREVTQRALEQQIELSKPKQVHLFKNTDINQYDLFNSVTSDYVKTVVKRQSIDEKTEILFDYLKYNQKMLFFVFQPDEPTQYFIENAIYFYIHDIVTNKYAKLNHLPLLEFYYAHNRGTRCVERELWIPFVV